jgi:hypothetical protein
LFSEADIGLRASERENPVRTGAEMLSAGTRQKFKIAAGAAATMIVVG